MDGGMFEPSSYSQNDRCGDENKCILILNTCFMLDECEEVLKERRCILGRK